MYFISLLGLAWNIGLFLQGLVSLFVLKKLRNNTPTNNIENEINIIVPIRNEDISHLKECVKYFLAEKNVSKIIICLTKIDDDHKKYLDLLDSIIKTDERLSYLTYNGNEGYKAEQINVALNMIVNSKEDLVVGIYDIDSRPDSKVFEYIKTNTINVGQQPILYDANLSDLGLLTTAGSLHQTSWALSFEMFNFIFPKSRLVYTVGHGLFLSTKVLKICGLFEEKCMTEDLMYGYKVSMAKMNFQIIPHYEHAKFVQKFYDFVPQSARWFGGELELIDRFSDWFNKFGGTLGDRKKYWLRLIELIWWPTERLIYIATLASALLGLISLEFALFYTLVLVVSGYISTIVISVNGKWNTQLFIAPLLIPVWHCVSVVGPVIAIIKRVLGTQVGWTVTKK